MSFDSDLEFIYETAKSDSADAKACRQVLISLWDDGEPDGCELLGLLTLQQKSFDAVTSVLQHLYAKRIQLDMFMSTKQITTLAEMEIPANGKSATKTKTDPYAHWL